MGKNTKPMLTVLVEGDKLQRFRDYAQNKDVSMGWVVNRLLDRVLSGELDVTLDNPSIDKSIGSVEKTSIDELVKLSIDKHLEGYLPIETVTQIAIGAIDKHIEQLGTTSTEPIDIERLTREFIVTALEPINESISELETYTKSQFVAVRDELKKPLAIVR